MKLLGNIIWVIFGGLEMAIGYFVSSLGMICTIIGIPFGLQTMKLGLLALWPFGHSVVETENSGSCLSIVMNVIWLFTGGLVVWFGHIVLGCIFYITIIGIPFGKQHFKLARLSLTPFGKQIN